MLVLGCAVLGEPVQPCTDGMLLNVPAVLCPAVFHGQAQALERHPALRPPWHRQVVPGKGARIAWGRLRLASPHAGCGGASFLGGPDCSATSNCWELAGRAGCTQPSWLGCSEAGWVAGTSMALHSSLRCTMCQAPGSGRSPTAPCLTPPAPPAGCGHRGRLHLLLSLLLRPGLQVAGREREASQQPVCAGAGEGAGHHLHR